MSDTAPDTWLDGPHFDDLLVGETVTSTGMTLTEGHQATHQAILGDRFPVFVDRELGTSVAGAGVAGLAHPSLVWDISIGQSTTLTRRVVANLFYKGLVFHRYPALGDTLTTTTTVRGRRRNTPRPGRAPTGMTVLEVKTQDQNGNTVLRFLRCAMLPVRSATSTTADDDVAAIAPPPSPPGGLAEAVSTWQLTNLPRETSVDVGTRRSVEFGDVVTSAPELARLTMNIAAVHHDEAVGGRRLVYGGHTIGLAAAQIARAFPSIVTIVAWSECQHLAPVYENDVLVSATQVDTAEALSGGGRLLGMTTRCSARSQVDGTRPVLLWRYQAVTA